jgi:hypothetical protein
MAVVLLPACTAVTWPWVYMSQYFNPGKELPLRTRIHSGIRSGGKDAFIVCKFRIAYIFYEYTRSAVARENIKRRFLIEIFVRTICCPRATGWGPDLEGVKLTINYT